jgi:glycosyltransferase involved in cell wall biosynthesis
LANRIALFFGNFNAGGVQRVRLHLANGFLERGYIVDLVVVNAVGEMRPQVPEGANVVDLAARGALSSISALRSYFREYKPAAVLSAQTNHNIAAIWARRLSGITTRLVVGEHNNMREIIKGATFRDRLRPLAARLIYPGADAILAVSHGVADALSALTGIDRNSIQVIYNPVVSSKIEELSQEDPLHPWLKQNDVPVIISIGSLSEQKDYTTLIKAFEHVRRNKQIKLIILGEGNLRHELQGLIAKMKLKDDIDLYGFSDNPYAFLKRASAYVLSSKYEGFPNTLLEALACGTPVVATDCPSGPAEMLENGRYGHLVPVGDAEVLSGAIQDVLDEPLPAQMLIQRAAEFSLDAIIEQYRKLLFPNIFNR